MEAFSRNALIKSQPDLTKNGEPRYLSLKAPWRTCFRDLIKVQ